MKKTILSFILLTALFFIPKISLGAVNCADTLGAISCPGGFVVLNAAGSAYTCGTAAQVAAWDAHCVGATNSVAVNCLGTRVTDAAAQPRSCTCSSGIYSYTTGTYSCSTCNTNYYRYPTCARSVPMLYDAATDVFYGEEGYGNDIWELVPRHDIGNLLDQLTGTVSVAAGSDAVTGVGTAFDTELVIGDAIKITDGSNIEIFTIDGITNATSLSLDSNSIATYAGDDAYRDDPLFEVDNGDEENQVFVTRAGNVGIGDSAPPAKLVVATKPGDNLVLTPSGDVSVIISSDGYDSFLETQSNDMAEGIVMHGSGTDSGLLRSVAGASGYTNGWVDGLHVFLGADESMVFTIDAVVPLTLTKTGASVGVDIDMNSQKITELAEITSTTNLTLDPSTDVLILDDVDITGTLTVDGIKNTTYQYDHTTLVANVAYPVIATDFRIAYTSLTDNRIVTIPNALCDGASDIGRVLEFALYIPNASLKNIVITPTGATINDTAYAVLNKPYGWLRIVCAATNDWFMVGNN